MESWTDLPAELQELIVQRLNENTRNALRACSRSTKQLVDNARVNVINELAFDDKRKKRFEAIVQYRRLNNPIEIYELSTNDCQYNRKVLNILLKPAHCIKNLKCLSMPLRFPLKFRDGDDKSTLLVENFNFCENPKFRIKNVLPQLEPGYLRRVTLEFDKCADPAIFDMPQIVYAEELKVGENSNIREEQLLKLNARNVSIRMIKCSLQQYIEKCAREAGTKMPKFSFTSSNFANMGLAEMVIQTQSSRLLLDTPHPGLKYELRLGKSGSGVVFLKGRVTYESEKCSKEFWRLGGCSTVVIDHLMIHSTDRHRRIKIRRKFYPTMIYDFKTAEELQQKMDVILENAELIKDFYIDFEGSQGKFKWKPRKSKLMVKTLFVVGNNSKTSIRDLLLQIDPAFSMGLKIIKNAELASSSLFFDMPVIQNAHSITIENPYLSDKQLAKLNAKYLDCRTWLNREVVQNRGTCNRVFKFFTCLPTFLGGERENAIESITGAAVNQYIKKLLRTINHNQRNFDLGVVARNFDKEAMLEGLEIIKINEMEWQTQWIINTPIPSLIFELKMTDRREVLGMVKTRER